ncbi:MAG: VOC family protein [Microbacteriaceae bacterium]
MDVSPRVYGPYHTAFVVPSLEETMDEFTRILGLRWREARTAPLRVRTHDGDVIDATSRFVHSQGAPSIELFEGVANTYLEGGDRPRFHHIGYWVDDLASRSAEVSMCGWAWQQDVVTSQHPMPPAAIHETSFGYLELLNLEFPRGEYYSDLYPPHHRPR